MDGRNQRALTVGPLNDDLGETAGWGELLYQLCVEAMDVRKLRQEVGNHASPKPADLNQLGSIRCLQALAEHLGGATAEEAEEASTPLRDLNSIRQADAHPSALSAQDLRTMYGIRTGTSMVPVWDAIVDRTVEAMKNLAGLIGDVDSGT